MSARQGVWRAVGESVIGITHERDQRPSQDAVRIHLSMPEVVVAAVADGHGQPKSFRSGLGASLAAEVAVDVLVRFAHSGPQLPDAAFGARKDLAGHLPRIVAQTWRDRVMEHVERCPFSLAELTLLGERFPIVPGQSPSPDAYRDLWRAYGTTLVAVLVTSPYSLALQIGDGLLMAAGASGGAFEVLDPDGLNFGTSTTSLSDEDAELRLRWRLIPHEGDYPILYWLSTDGYEKAFRSEDLAGVCLEYREAFRKPDGWRVIRENLKSGLRHASESGTGDDATAAFLFFDEDETVAAGGIARTGEELSGVESPNGRGAAIGQISGPEPQCGSLPGNSSSDVVAGTFQPPSADGSPPVDCHRQDAAALDAGKSASISCPDGGDSC